MKGLFTIVLTLIVTSGCAANPALVTKSFDAICINSIVFSQTLEKYGEEPALTMMTNREISGKVEPRATVLFINYTTKTWTMAEQVGDDLYCVTGVGSNARPYLPKDFF